MSRITIFRYYISRIVFNMDGNITICLTLLRTNMYMFITDTNYFILGHLLLNDTIINPIFYGVCFIYKLVFGLVFRLSRQNIH